MDRILRGVFASDHSENVKTMLVQQLATKASNAIPEAQCRSIFEMSADLMMKGSSVFNHDMGRAVLTSWAKHNREVFERFFSVEYLNSVLTDPENVFIHVVNYLRTSFGLLRETSHVLSLYKIVRDRAHSWVKDNTAIEFNGSVGRLLIDHDECWPVGEHLLQLNVSLVHSLAKTELPKPTKEELKACIQNAGIIGALLSRMWAKEQRLIFPVLNELFTVISGSGVEPSVAIASIVQYFPQEVMESATRAVVSKPGVSDKSLELALLRMIKCVSWPGGKAVDQWIIRFVKALAEVQKHSILMSVTMETVTQVFSRLYFPVVRESAMAVLSHLLLSYQHSPQPFHLIVEHVPELVKNLKKENSPSSQLMLQTLAELLHCLMYLHTGFPELYSPLLDVLQDYPRPSDTEIKKWLAHSGAWSASGLGVERVHSPLAQACRSETGKTGLVNLGNSCYMNSVLQAIFMLDEFRSLTLLQPVTITSHPLLYHLQELVAYLTLTQRAAIEPVKFLRVARPPWFSAGSQQDCSEFLKYLLDRLDEEGKAPSPSAEEARDGRPPTMVEQTFVGKLKLEHICSRCGQTSCREEAFTDLPLAFPQSAQHVERPCPAQPNGGKDFPESMDTSGAADCARSLKGGDISQNSSDITCPGSERDEASAPAGRSGASTSGSAPLVSIRPELPAVSALDAPGVTLQSMLDYFLQPEVLEGSNQYHCEHCQSLQDAERRVSISRAPRFLVLTLKRFAYNVKTQMRSKILQNVDYPSSFKLNTGAAYSSGQKDAPKNGEANELKPSLKRTRQNSDCGERDTTETGRSETVYALCSVIVHSGTSSESGHYYCYARSSSALAGAQEAADSRQSGRDLGAGSSDDTWCLFNDSRVSFARYSAFASVAKRFPTDTPYVLIYKNLSEPSLECVADIREEFLAAVGNDNRFFQEAQERDARIRADRKAWTATRHRDDDNDRGPPGSCGGGPGYNAPFNRFIF